VQATLAESAISSSASVTFSWGEVVFYGEQLFQAHLPIFLSKQKRPIDRTTLHLLMKKYGAEAGIPPHLRHFHVLKHCCATHLLSKGFGVERVQDWIGHANIQSTMEYAKVTNARRDDMAQQLKETWR